MQIDLTRAELNRLLDAAFIARAEAAERLRMFQGFTIPEAAESVARCEMEVQELCGLIEKAQMAAFNLEIQQECARARTDKTDRTPENAENAPG